MKIKNNYKKWGIMAAIVIILISGLLFILSQGSNLNNDEPNIPITEVPRQEPTEPVENKEEQPLPAEQEEPIQQETFKLFTGDIDTYEKKEIEVIEIDESLSIEKKLELIAEEISQVQFDNLPIEIQAVEEIEDKKIAIINLIEREGADKIWMQYINSGSAGSTITLITLEESFLQRDFEGEWVDGIKIILEGKEIEEMDHFPGSQIIYRKS